MLNIVSCWKLQTETSHIGTILRLYHGTLIVALNFRQIARLGVKSSEYWKKISKRILQCPCKKYRISKGLCTGKSLSEALIFALTNPQYDDSLFIELQVQYMKSPSSKHEEIMLCTEIVSLYCTLHSYHHNSSRTIRQAKKYLWYCGLVNAKIRASDKDVPVRSTYVQQGEQ